MLFDKFVKRSCRNGSQNRICTDMYRVWQSAYRAMIFHHFWNLTPKVKFLIFTNEKNAVENAKFCRAITRRTIPITQELLKNYSRLLRLLLLTAY